MTKVALIEDDKFLVRTSKASLEQKGYEVVIYESGENTHEDIKNKCPTQ